MGVAGQFISLHTCQAVHAETSHLRYPHRASLLLAIPAFVNPSNRRRAQTMSSISVPCNPELGIGSSPSRHVADVQGLLHMPNRQARSAGCAMLMHGLARTSVADACTCTAPQVLLQFFLGYGRENFFPTQPLRVHAWPRGDWGPTRGGQHCTPRISTKCNFRVAGFDEKGLGVSRCCDGQHPIACLLACCF